MLVEVLRNGWFIAVALMLTGACGKPGATYSYEAHTSSYTLSDPAAEDAKQQTDFAFGVHRLRYVDSSGFGAMLARGAASTRAWGPKGQKDVDPDELVWTTEPGPVVDGMRTTLELAWSRQEEVVDGIENEGDLSYTELRFAIGFAAIRGLIYHDLDAVDFTVRRMKLDFNGPEGFNHERTEWNLRYQGGLALGRFRLGGLISLDLLSVVGNAPTASKLGLVAGYASYPFLAEVRLEGSRWTEFLGSDEEVVTTRGLVFQGGFQF